MDDEAISDMHLRQIEGMIRVLESYARPITAKEDYRLYELACLCYACLHQRWMWRDRAGNEYVGMTPARWHMGFYHLGPGIGTTLKYYQGKPTMDLNDLKTAMAWFSLQMCERLLELMAELDWKLDAAITANDWMPYYVEELALFNMKRRTMSPTKATRTRLLRLMRTEAKHLVAQQQKEFDAEALLELGLRVSNTGGQLLIGLEQMHMLRAWRG